MKSGIDLVLGSAMWGWTVPRERCFALLDTFYALGGRQLDGATNYPINKHAADFHAAANILAEWITTHGITDLEVMMKVGSVNNLRTPECNLSPSFLLISADKYRYLLGSNLRTLMIHWDNREAVDEIRTSLEALAEIKTTGLNIGLSGIKHPNLYAQLLGDYDLGTLPLQLKHNLLYSDTKRYAPLLTTHCYGIAYGINAGGIKLDAEKYRSDASLVARGGTVEQHTKLVQRLRSLLITWQKNSKPPTPQSMNHLGMLYAAYHPAIKSILLGTSRVEQLRDSWAWAQHLSETNYDEKYEQLVRLEV